MTLASPWTFAGTAVAEAAGTTKAAIAVVGSASGSKAENTRVITEAVQRAARRLSDSGEMAFAVESADDDCTPSGARTVAAELAAKGIMFVVGHPCEAAAAAAAEVYAAHGIIFFATGTRHPDFTAKRAGPTVFRLTGSDAAQGAAAAAALKAAAGERPIAIVHDRTLYAKTIAEAAAAVLKAGKRDAITATIIAGDKEYGRLVAKIKDAGAVFFAGFPLEAGFIAASLRRVGSTAQLIASDAVATREFTSSFPAEARRTWVLLASRQDTAAKAEAALEIFAAAFSHVRADEKAAADRRVIAVVTAAGTSRTTAAGRDKRTSDKARGAQTSKPAGNTGAGTEVATAPPSQGARLAGAIAEGSYATVLGEIRFENSGDAALRSFDVRTWDGTEWVPVSASGR